MVTAKKILTLFVVGSVLVTLTSIRRVHVERYIMRLSGREYPSGIPATYETEVDLRIIVITYNRAESVMKLLNSLQELELDGDEAALEIWLDRSDKGEIHEATYKAVSSFKWSKGPTWTHNQTAHVGIMGQWIDTWRPLHAPSFEPKNTTATATTATATATTSSSSSSSPSYYDPDPRKYREMGLILEDDLTLSRHAYRWLKAVHRKYIGRPDYAGSTLTSDVLFAHNSNKPLVGPKNDSAFMYVCIGTWGFAPAPHYWAEFQDWFHYARNLTGPKFRPRVPGAVPSSWYDTFVQRGTEDHMWEMWFIYFANLKGAYTAYSNIEQMNGGNRNSCVCVNRQEIGLHYHSKGADNQYRLLKTWDPRFGAAIPDDPVKLDWNGNVIPKPTTKKTAGKSF